MVQAGRERTRVVAGREPTPRAAGRDSPAVQTTEMGGRERGEDGGKHMQGRKRQGLVETWGWLLAILIPRAGRADGAAAPLLLGHVTPHDCPRLPTICADQQYHTQALDAWMAAHRAGGRIAVQARPAGAWGFIPRKPPWGMARPNAWHGRYRRHSKDYGRTTASSTAMRTSSPIHLRLNRLAPSDRPAFHDRTEAACSRGHRVKRFPDSLSTHVQGD